MQRSSAKSELRCFEFLGDVTGRVVREEDVNKKRMPVEIGRYFGILAQAQHEHEMDPLLQ